MASSSQELPHPRLLYAIRIWLIVIVSLLFLLNICGGLLELLLEDYQNEMERTTIMTAHDLDTLLIYNIFKFSCCCSELIKNSFSNQSIF